MNRTDFYNETTIDSTQEFDYLYNSISNFRTDYPVTYYKITDSDLMRPDLISYQVYGTVDYWWIICYLNQIHNPFSDIKIGMVLAIPNVLDIFQFAKKYSIR